MADPNFSDLTLRDLRRESNEAVTLVFDRADGFGYRAGQYVTLKFVIDGKEERRAYSMCSAPFDDHIAVTVKRVRGGVVSNHVASNLKPGDTVAVMKPDGRFKFDPDPAARRAIYLFGAGSGITPLMSILRTALEQEPKSTVYLLYGNRDENSIIYQDRLRELEEKYRGQLVVEHTLSRPIKVKAGGLKGLFGGRTTQWDGRQGRIDRTMVTDFLAQHPPRGQDELFYICGPGQLIDTTEAALLGHGASAASIHHERFVSANQARKHNPDSAGGGAVVRAKISGKEHTIELKAGQSVLDGLLEAGATPPYSCLAGACSTCMAKVEKGGVKMDVCYALDDEEVAEGFVLACQSHPTTDTVEVDFDV